MYRTPPYTKREQNKKQKTISIGHHHTQNEDKTKNIIQYV
jgi:hypothetical protein